MTDKIFRFSVGKINCILIPDGVHDYAEPSGLLFPDAPKEELRKELLVQGVDPDNWSTWTSDYKCLLIDTGKQLVLLDTGAGALLPEAGQLIKNMMAAGIEPGDIDVIIISHAHPDHIGGAANFPSARIIMSRKEWEFWLNEPELPRLPPDFRQMLVQMIPPLLLPLERRVELIDSEIEITAGIKIVETPGHTPGHIALSVSSEGDELLYTGDAVLHPVHVRNPEWNALVDVLPDKAEETRKGLLTHAYNTNAVFFGFHFPHPGKIVNAGDTLTWESL